MCMRFFCRSHIAVVFLLKLRFANAVSGLDCDVSRFCVEQQIYYNWILAQRKIQYIYCGKWENIKDSLEAGVEQQQRQRTETKR